MFVTGGAGFIGSRLCRKLLDEGHVVKVFDNFSLGEIQNMDDCQSPSFEWIKGDLLNLEQLEGAAQGFDCIWHMAANSDIQAGTLRTDTDLQMGTLATYHVCEVARRLQIKKIVFASTSAVYGETSVKPTPENYGPLLPISLYGASKLACEALLSAFSNNFGIQVWIYRFANIVGTPSTHGAIHDFAKRLKKDPSVLNVLGNGTQRKSYLHVSDCVDGLLFGFKNLTLPLNLVNLASHGVTSVKEIAEAVIEEWTNSSGKRPLLQFGQEDRGWVGDVPFTWLDDQRMTAVGWKARLDSGQAMRKAVQQVLDQPGFRP